MDSIIRRFDDEMFGYHAALLQEEEEYSAVSPLNALCRKMINFFSKFRGLLVSRK